MRLPVALLLLFSVAGSGAWAADEITDRAVPTLPKMQPAPPLTDAVAGAQASIEQQVGLLQQQVGTLQAQLAMLQAAVQVTANGVTLRGPTVTIAGGVVTIEAQNTMALNGHSDMSVRASANLSVSTGGNTSVQTGSNLTLRSGAGALLQASGPLDLKGSTILLNGGTKPLATVGSQVQVPGQPIGQVITGSPTVLGN
ncbi:MAG: hypothetical protein KGJ82_05295 [Nitrospirota bacterium]|nr:hypothetical protein [Nitrospirota bacterium]MDE3049244.1 hypothetical protein [Nitrospirota bacterium]